jgi:hypothetical protein
MALVHHIKTIASRPLAVSATESVALPPSSNSGEARCNGAASNRQNPFKIASHLSLGTPERKPLSFHLGRSAMHCLKKHGWPMLAPTWRIGLTRPLCSRRSRPLLGTCCSFAATETDLAKQHRSVALEESADLTRTRFTVAGSALLA